MGLLVLGVEIGVVRAPGLQHAPKDFKQTLAEATQGAGVALSFLALLLGINPDSNKWSVPIPERGLTRSEALDYYDGEE